MGLSNVNINIKNNSLSKTGPTKDHVSGMLFYSESVTNINKQELYRFTSLVEAEEAGITEQDNPLQHYHLNEFFKQNDSAICYVYIVDTGSTYDFQEIETFQNKAEGELRQIGIVAEDYDLNTTDITEIKNVVQDLNSKYQPLQVILSYDPGFTSTSDVNDMDDLKSGDYENRFLSIVIGSDSVNSGDTSQLGATLGVLSGKAVNKSIAEVGNTDISLNTTEFSNIKIGGIDYSEFTEGQLDTLHDKGYIFLRKFPNKAGTYISSANIITPFENDFQDIQTSRTVNKGVRLIYQNVVDLLNSDIEVDEDGLISKSAIDIMTDKAEAGLERMNKRNEISQYKVLIKRDQDIVNTEEINMDIKIVPYGTMKDANITLALASKV